MNVGQLLRRVKSIMKENLRLSKENEELRYKIATWAKILLRERRDLKRLHAQMKAERLKLRKPKKKK